MKDVIGTVHVFQKTANGWAPKRTGIRIVAMGDNNREDVRFFERLTEAVCRTDDEAVAIVTEIAETGTKQAMITVPGHLYTVYSGGSMFGYRTNKGLAPRELSESEISDLARFAFNYASPVR